MTYLYSHCKVCAWVIAIAIAISTGSVLGVPQYSDSFEGTAEGSLPSGWGAQSGTAVVTQLQAAVAADWVGTEPDPTGTNLLYVAQDADATNGTPVTGTATSNVWVDMWISPNLYDGVETNRSVADVGGSSAVFFFNTNGNPVVLDGDTPPRNWVVLTDATLTDNDSGETNMQRVTVYMNYSNDTWDLFIKGLLVEENIDFYDTGNTELSRLTLSDDVYADMITVSASNYPGSDTWASGVEFSSDQDFDRIEDSWELHHFGDVADHSPGTDTDGDGRTDSQEYQDGTDPNDGSDASWVIPYFEQFTFGSVGELDAPYQALTELVDGVAIQNSEYIGAMSGASGDGRGISLAGGGISVVVSNITGTATNIFCQVYVQPVACPEVPSNAVSDEAAAICVVSNTLYVYSGQEWTKTTPELTDDNLTNGTWVGLAAHLDYNADQWDLYYTFSGNLENSMQKLNASPMAFGSNSTAFTELIITNESSVATYVDAIAVSYSHEPTDGAYTNLAIFERLGGQAQITEVPPYNYDVMKLFDDGGTDLPTEMAYDLALGLSENDTVLVSNKIYTVTGGKLTKEAAGHDTLTEGTPLLLTRLPGADTLTFYPYSNVTALVTDFEVTADSLGASSAGRTDVAVPTYLGDCFDINDATMQPFPDAGQDDELFFYDPDTYRTTKFKWNDTLNKWQYKGSTIEKEICPGITAFTYYRKSTGEVTWAL